MDKKINLNKIHFLHLRNRADMDDNTILPCGGATIAFRVEHDECEGVDNCDAYVVDIGIAQCMESDNFKKRIGRDISTARLLSGKDVCAHIFSHHPTIKEVIEVVKETYYLEKEQHFSTVRLYYR